MFLSSNVSAWMDVLNCSLAKNCIQIKQFSELQQILTSHKQPQFGKHNILRGKTIIATPEMVQQLEAATQSRKSKRRKLKYPFTPLPQTIENLVNYDSEDSNSDEDILDCIVVASA